jgi:hypothetical protein
MAIIIPYLTHMKRPRKHNIHPVIQDFLDTLKAASYEAPLQQFISGHPWILGAFGPFKYVFDKPRVGPKYVTDFATVGWGNYEVWNLIELESPRASLFTRTGIFSHHLNNAIRQVNDWSIWVRDFDELGGEQIVPLNGEVTSSTIVIGKRNLLSAVDKRRLIQLNQFSPGGTIKIVTYDALIDSIASLSDEEVKAFEARVPELRTYRTIHEFKNRQPA